MPSGFPDNWRRGSSFQQQRDRVLDIKNFDVSLWETQIVEVSETDCGVSAAADSSWGAPNCPAGQNLLH